MKRLMFLILMLLMMSSCRTIQTDETGKPSKDGDYVAKQFAGVTFSLKKQPTRFERVSANFDRFLYVAAGIGAVGFLAGLCLLWFKHPYWDEVMAPSVIVLVTSALLLFLWELMLGILLAGAGGYLIFRVWKSTRKVMGNDQRDQ